MYRAHPAHSLKKVKLVSSWCVVEPRPVREWAGDVQSMAVRKGIAGLAALALLAFSTVAQADQASGWKNWADHGERVMAAVRTNNMAEVDSACIGTTKTIVSQGFQFPYWGQMLPQFCRQVESKNVKREVTLRGWMQECKQLRQVKGALAKAQPIDLEPRAKPLADEMVNVLQAIDVRDCSNPPRRR